MPDYQVTVVCGGCGERHKVLLGDRGVCQCGKVYDTNRLSQETVHEIASRAATYRARRRYYIIQMLVVALGCLVVARSAPWQVTLSVVVICWYWFGIRGYRRMRQNDREPERYSL